MTVVKPFLSLVAPTYNERSNIPILVERVHRSLGDYPYELIIVDDNSPDGTAEVARELSQQYPIRVISRHNEKGLASAIVEGFKSARGSILGVIDADLQHPPEKIPALLQEIESGADVAIASRYIPGGGVRDWNFIRRTTSWGATILAHLLLSSTRKINDPLSGFFLLKKEVIEGVELKPIGYKILLEVLGRGKAKETKEVPFIFEGRKHGESKLSLSEEVKYLKQLYSLVRGGSSTPANYYEQGMKRHLVQRYWHNKRFNKVGKMIEGILDFGILNSDKNPKSEISILDIGCDGGLFTSKITGKIGGPAVGIDIDRSHLAHAWETYSLTVLQADAHSLPFKDNTFDLVTCLEVLEHVPQPAKVIQEGYRCLKNSGQFIILVPHENWLFKLIWFFWTASFGKTWEGKHVQHFDQKNLTALLEGKGLKVTEVVSFNLGMLIAVKAVKL
jgi:glycosyltransferase involved in cell wall biosynthesis